MSNAKPDITLYFLNSSRAIRVAWLLEELNLPYNLISADRAPNGLSPPDFKSQIPNALGKSPTIKDGQVVITESGAILEYLCEQYDHQHRLLPNDIGQRAEVKQWLHAAEGTFMVHAMAILYARWQVPEEGKGMLEGMEERMSRNVKNDLRWLEGVLSDQQAKGRHWIVGEGLSVADIQLQFRWVHTYWLNRTKADECTSIEFIFERKLGVDPAENEFPQVKAWLERTKAEKAYRRAVDKTGYTLDGDFKK